MLLASSNIAEAHDEETLDEWVDEWIDRVLDEGVTIEAFNEWTALARRHPRFFNRPVPHEHRAGRQTPVVGAPTTRGWPVGVEQWRSLVTKYFPASQVERALRVMACESGGRPSALGKDGDKGLFQHLQRFWSDRSVKAGWAGASIWDPTANVAVAAWLQRTGGWIHWSCRG